MDHAIAEVIDPASTELPAWFLIAVAVILGTVLGSFLNVVVFRLPRGMSLSHPGSRCTTCGHPIRGRDNIPILGWMLLRGKCRDCHTPISKRYPAVELLVALLAGARAWQLLSADTAAGQGELALLIANFLFSLALMVTLLAIGLIDFEGFRVPRSLVGMAACTAAGLLWSKSPDVVAAADWLFGAMALGSAALLALVVTRRRVPALSHARWAACTAIGMLAMIFVPPDWTARLGVLPQPLLHLGMTALMAICYAITVRSLSAVGS